MKKTDIFKNHICYLFDVNMDYYSFRSLYSDLKHFFNKESTDSFILNDAYVCTYYIYGLKSFIDQVEVDCSSLPVKNTTLNSLIQGNCYRFKAGTSVIFPGEVLGTFWHGSKFLLIKVCFCEGIYLIWKVRGKMLPRLEALYRMENGDIHKK